MERRSRRCSRPAPSATCARRRASSRRSAFAVRGGAVAAATRVARRRRRCERYVARRHEHAGAGRAESELRGCGSAARARRGSERRRRRLDRAAPDRARAPVDARLQPARAPSIATSSRVSSSSASSRRAAPTSTRGRAGRDAGTTPFLLATRSLDLPYMRTLLELGADPKLDGRRRHDGRHGGRRRRPGPRLRGRGAGLDRGSDRGAHARRSSSAPARSTT